MRPPATRSRAGNAMGRTRESALRGAVAAVAKYGSRKATMGDIAMLAGIAKATLYNHFRTREDVYRAAVEAEVEAVAQAALARRPDGLAAVIEEAARLIAEHPAVRRIARDEPVALAALATIGDSAAWAAARAHLLSAVGGEPVDGELVHGAASSGAASSGIDVVLRYLASQLLSPSSADERRAAARVLASGLTGAAQAT